jgi:hypothetical protein
MLLLEESRQIESQTGLRRQHVFTFMELAMRCRTQEYVRWKEDSKINMTIRRFRFRLPGGDSRDIDPLTGLTTKSTPTSPRLC